MIINTNSKGDKLEGKLTLLDWSLVVIIVLTFIAGVAGIIKVIFFDPDDKRYD
jgi:hypothetical protein